MPIIAFVPARGGLRHMDGHKKQDTGHRTLFWIWNQAIVDDGEVSRRRYVAVGISDRWKVT